MGKKVPEHPVPLWFADIPYKLWVKEKLEEKKWSYEEFARRIQRAAEDPRITATDSSVSQFFGTKDSPMIPSNTSWMPAINKIFGEPPPPICDPKDKTARLLGVIRQRIAELTPSERTIVNTIFGVKIFDDRG